MPIQNGIHTHKLRPVLVRGTKMCQELAVGVRSPRAHEYGLDRLPIAEVLLEGGAHTQRVPLQVEVVLLGRAGDELLDLGERVGRRDVDPLQGAVRGRGRIVVGSIRVS